MNDVLEYTVMYIRTTFFYNMTPCIVVLKSEMEAAGCSETSILFEKNKRRHMS
jgi:hypothetical protein